MDTWLLLRNFESNGERNRGLSILKSRGMPHSNQVREFVLSSQGIELIDVPLGSEGVLMGSARVNQAAHEQAARLLKQHERRQRQQTLERKRRALALRIDTLQAEFATEEQEFQHELALAQLEDEQLRQDRAARAQARQVPGPAAAKA